MTDAEWRSTFEEGPEERTKRRERAILRYEATRRVQWLLQEVLTVCPGLAIVVTIEGVVIPPYRRGE